MKKIITLCVLLGGSASQVSATYTQIPTSSTCMAIVASGCAAYFMKKYLKPEGQNGTIGIILKKALYHTATMIMPFVAPLLVGSELTYDMNLDERREMILQLLGMSLMSAYIGNQMAPSVGQKHA